MASTSTRRRLCSTCSHCAGGSARSTAPASGSSATSCTRGGRGPDGGPLRAAGGRPDAGGGGVMSAETQRLFHRPAPPAELLITNAHVLDPRADLDEPHDVLIRDGRIAELGSPGSLRVPENGDSLDAAGKHLFPGFVDPHVHLRSPGQ